MIQMELSQILISETREEQVIMLRELNGSRTFPIVIGSYEAITLNRKLNNSKSPRPLTHDLIDNIIKGLNAKLTSVLITQLKNNTFYAKLILEQNSHNVEIDARPSDAIILATQSKAPILVSEEVFTNLNKKTSE
jgi:bifunctional DNase/RNase